MGAGKSLSDVVEPLLTAAGLELWELEQVAGVLRILVDRPGGVDLDTLGSIAQELSAALDAHDELVPDHRYHLEVSSPGLERTLRTPGQFRRFTGTQVSVKTTAPLDGARRFSGVLVAADDAGITIGLDQPITDRASRDTGPSRRFGYDQIQQARTVLQWGPAPKPGQVKSRLRAGPAEGRTGGGAPRAATPTTAARTARSSASTKDAS